MKVVISRSAKKDIAELCLHRVEIGIENAARLSDALFEHCNGLAFFPQKHERCLELGSDVHRYVIENGMIKIYYRVRAKRVEVLHIRASRTNFPKSEK